MSEQTQLSKKHNGIGFAPLKLVGGSEPVPFEKGFDIVEIILPNCERFLQLPNAADDYVIRSPLGYMVKAFGGVNILAHHDGVMAHKAVCDSGITISCSREHLRTMLREYGVSSAAPESQLLDIASSVAFFELISGNVESIIQEHCDQFADRICDCGWLGRDKTILAVAETPCVLVLSQYGQVGCEYLDGGLADVNTAIRLYHRIPITEDIPNSIKL